MVKFKKMRHLQFQLVIDSGAGPEFLTPWLSLFPPPVSLFFPDLRQNSRENRHGTEPGVSTFGIHRNSFYFEFLFKLGQPNSPLLPPRRMCSSIKLISDTLLSGFEIVATF